MKRIIPILILLFSFSLGQIHTENDDYTFGLKLYEQGFYSQSIQVFQRFASDYPQSSFAADAKFYVGLAYFVEGNYTESKAAFQEMAVSYPESSRALDAWYYVGDCNEHLGNYSEAAKAYLNVKLLSPKDPLAPKSVNRASINFLLAEQLDQAENTARIVLDLYPDSREYLSAQVTLGRIDAQRQNYDRAVNWFRQVIKATGTDRQHLRVEAYRNMAVVELSRGRFNEAEQAYSKIVNSTTIDSLKAMGILGKSKLFLLTGQYPETQQLLKKAKSLKLTTVQKQDISLLQVAYYLLTGNTTEAYRTSQNILNDERPQALAYYSEVLLSIKKYKNVIQLWKKYQNEIDIKDPYAQMFLLNALRASLRSGSPEISNAINYSQNQLGYSSIFATTLAKELIYDFQNGNRELIAKWGRHFVNAFPKHSDADIIAWWSGLQISDNVKQEQRLRVVINEYPAGDYTSEESYRLFMNRKLDVDIASLVPRILDLQIKQITLQNPQEAIPDFAELYLDLGQQDKAFKLLSRLDYKGLSKGAQLHARYLTGIIFLNKYLANTNNTSDLKESQKMFKIVISVTDNNPFLEIASEKIVDVSLILMPSGKEKQNKTYQYYEALTRKYPDSEFRWKWLKKMGESQVPLIQKKGDDAYDNSVSALNEVLNSDISDVDIIDQIRLDLARAYQRSGENEKAISYFNTVIDRSGRSKQQLEALIDAYPILSELYPQIAGARLYQIIDIYGYSSKVWDRINSISVAKWPKNAEKLFSDKFYRIPVLDPIFKDIDQLNLGIALLLGEYFLNGREYDRSIAYLNYVYVQNPEKAKDTGLIKMLAIASEETRQYKAAVWYWRQIFELTKGAEKNHSASMIAHIYFIEGSYNLVINELKKIDLAKLPAVERKEILQLSYESYLRENKKSLADKFQAKYKSQFSNSPELSAASLIALGDYYLRQNNYNKAMKSFKSAASKGKKTEYYDDAEFKKAIVKVRLNQIENAFEDLSDFLDDFPNSNRRAEVYMTLAQLYIRVEKMDEALSAYKKSFAEANDDKIWKMAGSNLTKLAYDMGLYNLSLNTAQAYLQKFPDSADEANKRIIVGKCYANLGQTELAISYLKKLKQEVDSESEPEIQFAIGEIYFNQKNYEMAIIEFLKIPVMSKRTKLQWEASALYYAGNSYEKMGKTDEAVKMYEEIIKRPGILADLKKAARDRIKKIKS